MKIEIYLVLLLNSWSMLLSAQNLSESALWSRSSIYTNPRSIATGNSLFMFNGDVSNLYTNPTGLTQSSRQLQVEAFGSLYLNQAGSSVGGSVYAGVLPTVGGGLMMPIPLHSKKTKDASNLLYIGVGYHRENLSDVYWSRDGSGGLSGYLAGLANEQEPEARGLPVQLFVEGGRIQQDSSTQQYQAVMDNPPINNTSYSSRREGFRQDIAVGAGFELERWAFGATLRLPILNYATRESYYTDVFNYIGVRRVSGVGLSLRLGGQYTVSPRITLAATLQMPTLVFSSQRYAARLSVDADYWFGIEEGGVPVFSAGGGGVTVGLGIKIGPKRQSTLGVVAEGLYLDALTLKRAAAQPGAFIPFVVLPRIGASFATNDFTRLRIGAQPLEGSYSVGIGWIGKHLDFDLAGQYRKRSAVLSTVEDGLYGGKTYHQFHLHLGFRVKLNVLKG